MAEELSRRLKALLAEYESKPVRVMVVRDVGKLYVDGVEYELRKGTEVELPRWLARILEEKGIIEPLENPITIDDLARTHFNVTEAHSLADTPPLPEDFYARVREYLERLNNELRRNPTPALLEEKNRAELYLEEIVSKRIWTILQLLRSPGAKADIYARLAPEEKLLYDLLHEIIEEWIKAVLPSKR